MITINYSIAILGIILFCTQPINAQQKIVSKKSKLCGNAACDEVLFKSRVKRVMGINNDSNFLKLTENAVVDVVAVKFSDRYDIMEGKLSDGVRGFFYASAIDGAPYAEFLRTAIEEKKEMLMISQDPADYGDKKLLGYVHSEFDLVRDYNAKSAMVASDMGLPAPTPMPIPVPPNQGGHGHSHGGHGHSHGHSHGPPATTPPPVTTPPPPPPASEIREEPVPAPTTTPLPVETPVSTESPINEVPKPAEPQAEINLNNVLGSPPTIPQQEATTQTPQSWTDADIERLIQEEEEALKRKAAEEQMLGDNAVVEDVTQAPLILNELPAEPIIEQQQENAVPTPTENQIVNEPVPITTTPLPIVETPAVPVVVESTTLPPVDVTQPPVFEEPPVPVVTTPPPPPAQEETQPPPVVELTIEQTTPAPVAIEIVPSPDTVIDQVVQDVSSTPAPSVDNDLKGTCYKDECDRLQKTEPIVDDEDFKKWQEEISRESKPYENAYGRPIPNDSGPLVSSGIISAIRNALGLGNITDASVVFYFNLTFLLASVVFYLFAQAFSSSSESEKFDRVAYFQLTTKHKELELQLKAKNGEIQQLQALGAQQQQNVPAVNNQEFENLRSQYDQVCVQVNTIHAQLVQSANQCEKWRVAYDEKQTEIQRLSGVIEEYEQKLEKASSGGQEISRELDGIRSQLTESQHVVLSRQKELNDLKHEKDVLQRDYESIEIERRDLKEQLEDAVQKLDEIEIELKQAKIENSSLAEVIQQYEKNRNEDGSAAESGGSGWSDFGDNDEIETTENKAKEEKTPEASQAGSKYLHHGEESEELKELKEKLADVENELVKYKALYEKEQRSKNENENRSNNMEQDVVGLRKKIEELEAEKKESSNRMNELFKTLTVSMNKATESDQLIASLREEKYSKEKELLDADVEMRKKDDTIRVIDAELKKLHNEYAKLETKSFHDVMALKKKFDDYQKSQILGNSSMPLSRDVFNTSDNLPSNGIRDQRLGSPPDNPIWDEPEYAQPLGGSDDYFSSGSNTMPNKKRLSRRSDHRLEGEYSPSDRDEKSKSKKEVSQRRRSRSHGRQPQAYMDPFAQMPYLAGSSDSSFMSQAPLGFAPLTGRHSKSGHLHYSSGGSNGGRSPPPEMPLLSAIPPPGVRKPPSKRLNPNSHGK